MKTKLIIMEVIFVLILAYTSPLSALAQTTAVPCPGGQCDTAIGPIDANNAISLIGTLFRYVVSVAGVGAILLLLIGGYRMILSRGDKEKLHEARDTITSAVLGLVFIILSLVILQIIGVSILQIPGFE